MALTTIGILHTAISLVAVAAGAVALLRDKKISWNNSLGKIFVIGTIITCVTGFGIYQHGGFGKAHALGIVTLVVQALALFAGKSTAPFGKRSELVATLAYSFTFFLHLVPGITETMTRLPLDTPYASGPDAPNVQKFIGIAFVLFLVGATLQVSKLRREKGRGE